MLTLFIMYQHDLKISEYEVHKDNFRKLERTFRDKYMKEIGIMAFFFGLIILFSISSLVFKVAAPDAKEYWFEYVSTLGRTVVPLMHLLILMRFFVNEQLRYLQLAYKYQRNEFN